MEERLQTENAVVTEKSGVDFITVLNVLRRFWILLVVTTILGLAAGVVYARVKDKPVYTATKSVMFVVNVTELNVSTGSSGSTVANNATLAKRYLPDLAVYLTSGLFISRADAAYKGTYGENSGDISAKKVSVSYSANNLIFSISYSDSESSIAKNKLDAVITSSNETIQGADEEGSTIQGLIVGEDIELKPAQNYATVSVSTKTARIIVISTVLGLFIGAAIAAIIYLTDNTVRSGDELENLTGSSVIAYIEDVKR